MNTDLRSLAEFVSELANNQLDPRVASHGDKVLFTKIEGREIVWLDGEPIDLETHLEISKTRPVAAIKSTTLQSIVDFFEAGSVLSGGEAFVVVGSPFAVQVQSAYFTAGGSRDTFLVSKYEPFAHKFDQWLEVSDFVLWLLSGFEPNDASRQLLELLGRGVKIEAARQVKDDGVSTQLKRTRGAHAEWSNDVSPHFVLKPRRTFPEVEQPDQLCTFRVKNNSEDETVLVKLVESDGGLWSQTAIQNIGAWLDSRLDGVTILR